MRKEYSSCKILCANNREPARFIGTDNEGHRQEVVTQPVDNTTEVSDARNTVLILCEDGTFYTCHRDGIEQPLDEIVIKGMSMPAPGTYAVKLTVSDSGAMFFDAPCAGSMARYPATHRFQQYPADDAEKALSDENSQKERVDDLLDLLNTLNSEGKMEYGVYSALFDAVANLT